MAVLDLGQAPEEDRFQTELRLLVEDVVLVNGPPGFHESPATAQLDALVPLLPPGQTAVWLSPSSSGQLRASVAVVRDGRSEVRVVAVPPSDNAAAHLALAVREQLSARLADTPVPPAPDPGSPGRPGRVDSMGVVSSLSATGLSRAGPLAATGWQLGPLDRIGPHMAVEVGRPGVWLSPGLRLRRGWWTAGSDLALAWHPWGWQARPELWTGLQHTARSGLTVGASVAVLPIRDVVYDAEQLRFDSGRAELSAELLWTPASRD